MATNLVSYVMQFMTPDMIARIAKALGLSREDAQGGVAAAVPALLAALSGVAAKPGGAQSLLDSLKQNAGVLDRFADTISGGKQSSFIEKGSSSLTSLLGSHDQSALVGAVGKFAGLGQNGAQSLLGMLTPVVMGLISRQIGPRPDVSGLTGLLASQKEHIAQALPVGMSKLLSGTGLLDSLTGAVGSVTDAAGQAGRAAGAATDEVTQYASSAARSVAAAGQRAAGTASSGLPNWVYWAVPLIVIAGFLWYLVGSRVEQVVQQPTRSVQSVVVGGVDIGRQVNDSLAQLRSSLASITDLTSARAALPKLQEATAQIDKVVGIVGQLSPDQRKFVSGLIAPAMATINEQFDKVLAIPGVAEVMQPAVDTLKTRLADLSGQSNTVGVR
jgi:hypothetical protein